MDVAGAVEALPELSLDDASEVERQKATGTCDDRALAPMLAPNLVQASISGANADKTPKQGKRRDGRKPAAISAGNVKRKKPLPITDNGFDESGRLDSNQRPLRPERSALAKLSHAPFSSGGYSIDVRVPHNREERKGSAMAG